MCLVQPDDRKIGFAGGRYVSTEEIYLHVVTSVYDFFFGPLTGVNAPS